MHRLKPSSDWRAAFNNYLRTMPAYYATPLRRALTRMGAGNLASSLVPETLDNCLSYTVLNYLKRLKNQVCNAHLCTNTGVSHFESVYELSFLSLKFCRRDSMTPGFPWLA